MLCTAISEILLKHFPVTIDKIIVLDFKKAVLWEYDVYTF